MRITSALLDLLLGMLMLCLAGWALTGLPDSLRHYGSEPEDVWLLLAIIVSLVSFGALTILSGIVLLRQRRFGVVSRAALAAAALVGAMVLLSAALVGFIVSEPSSQWFRFLLLPSIALGLSYVLLTKTSVHGGPQ
jgi:hypothetical protein